MQLVLLVLFSVAVVIFMPANADDSRNAARCLTGPKLLRSSVEPFFSTLSCSAFLKKPLYIELQKSIPVRFPRTLARQQLPVEHRLVLWTRHFSFFYSSRRKHMQPGITIPSSRQRCYYSAREHSCFAQTGHVYFLHPAAAESALAVHQTH